MAGRVSEWRVEVGVHEISWGCACLCANEASHPAYRSGPSVSALACIENAQLSTKLSYAGLQSAQGGPIRRSQVAELLPVCPQPDDLGPRASEGFVQRQTFSFLKAS